MLHLPTPRHLPGAPAALVQGFWILVIITLALAVSLVIVASVNLVDAPGIAAAIGVLAALWALHMRAAHAHRADIERDVAFRRARERRGF